MKTKLIALAALAFGLAGCGGTSTPGSGGDGAAEVPASALAYATVDTNLSSDQWKTVDGLLDKFPGKAKLLTQLRQSFESDSKVSWDRDVKPALGDELDVAVTDLNGKIDAVALTQPKDDAKFKALLKKLHASDPSGSAAVTDDFDGWTLVSDSKAKLDAFEQAAKTEKRLADDSQYQDATSTIDGDALAKVYVNGPKATQKLSAFLGPAGAQGKQALAQIRKLRFAVAELVAEDNGLKVFADGRTTGANATKNYTPALLKVVPSGALAFISFRGLENAPGNLSQARDALRSMPQFGPLLSPLLKLEPLFAGENALYVLPGAPFPEVTLVTTPKNPARGTAAIDSLIAGLRPLLGGAAKVHQTQLDGVPARVLDFGRFSIYYGQAAGHVFVSSSQRVVSELRGGGQKLADDATFKEAEQAAGVGGATAGVVYLNLKDSIPLLESFAQLSGASLPPDLDANVRHLRTFLLFDEAKGNDTRYTAFLEIK